MLGHNFKVPCVNAALANGTAADPIELDNSYNTSTNHLAATIIPTALALAERNGVLGK